MRVPLNPRGPRARIVRGNALRRWVRSYRVRRALRGNIPNVNIRRRVSRFIPRYPRAAVLNRAHPGVVNAQVARYIAARRRLASIRNSGLSVRRPRVTASRVSRRRRLVVRRRL